jgi:hypothetical protein
VSAGAQATDGGGALEALLSAAVLAVDGRELSGRDLVAAGVVSGRWPRLEHELREGLGRVAAAPPPADAVAEVVRAFRLDRGLLSAADLRAWMDERGLTLAAVKAAAARTLVRDRGDAPEVLSAERVAAALPAEAIYSGALREMGFWLADRILSAASADATVEPIALERTVVQRLVFAETRTVAGGASPEAGVERARRLGWIAALDEAHRAWVAGAVSARDVERRLREKELEWCRFELDEMRLATPGAAAEAARQLAEGVPAAEVAALAGVPLAAESVVLADTGPERARGLLGAVAGDVAGPWSDGSVHVVARVRARRVPDAGDEQMAERAREELLTDVLTRLRAGRVRWYERA